MVAYVTLNVGRLSARYLQALSNIDLKQCDKMIEESPITHKTHEAETMQIVCEKRGGNCTVE